MQLSVPWSTAEDVVLCAVIQVHLAQQKLKPEAALSSQVKIPYKFFNSRHVILFVFVTSVRRCFLLSVRLKIASCGKFPVSL
jgi:hypothetical protein